MKKNPSRRTFLKQSIQSSIALGAFSAIPGSAMASQLIQTVPFSQTPLPYSFPALEPIIDAMTMEIHYTKHASAYTKNLNDAALLEFKGQNIKLEDALKTISTYSPKLRNNGGGHYNHELFWKAMQAPGGPGMQEGAFKTAMMASFNSMENFKTKLSDAAMTRFGSGWAWLILKKEGGLAICSTPNQDNPMMDIAEIKGFPLLGLDVWEHAYYLKYQNKRPDYIANWWNLVNWEYVQKRYDEANH
jgi:Fe-Mn family superoxide dismutase